MHHYSLCSLDGADDPSLSDEYLKPGEPFHPLQSYQVVPVTSIPPSAGAPSSTCTHLSHVGHLVR